LRVVTTCHKAGMQEYGWKWLDSKKHWKAEFLMYGEGFEADRDVADIPELEAFKRRYAGYRAPDWRFDVVRFANKAFAAYDALRNYDGIGVWLDADCVTYKRVPKGLIEKQVEGAYIACYQRAGMYTETGLWIVDCTHPQHGQFMDTFRDWYTSGKFKGFGSGWHDCIAFDYAIKATGVPVNNLSGDQSRSMHPMAVTELGRYIDHQKGARKQLDKSPENKFRKVA
jgi:hypothetical protein